MGVVTLVGLSALGWLIRHTYKVVRRLAWFVRKIIKQGETGQTEQENTETHVKDTVDEPNPTTEDQPTTQPRPIPRMRVAIMPGPTTNPEFHEGTSPMFGIMKSAHDQMAGIQHRGNMTTRAEAYDMPAIIALLAEAFGMRVDQYRRESLDPTFIDLYTKIQESLLAVADQTRTFGTYFDALHPERVRDLTSGANPEGWDTHNNQTVG